MLLRLKKLPKRSQYLLAAIGVVSFCVVLLLILNAVGGSRRDKNGWQEATTVAPQSLVKQAIAQNYQSIDNSPLNIKAIQLALNTSNGTIPLYVFYFATPQLCGIQGCLYAAYLQTKNKYSLVLAIFLNPTLPLKSNFLLFQIGDELSNNLSCLLITQPLIGERVKQLRYCYDGQQFKLVNSSQGKAELFNLNFSNLPSNPANKN